MLTKNCLAILASAAIANGAVNPGHRHGARHPHDKKAFEKKAIVYIETDTVTETDWVTVTVDPDAPTSTSVPAVVTPSTSAVPTTYLTTSAAPVTTKLPSTSETPTTLVTSTQKAIDQVQVAAVNTPVTTSSSAAVVKTTPVYVTPTTSETPVVVATSAAAAATTSTASTVASTSTGNKRGAAYNVASLVTPLLGSDSKLSWAYNWGQVSDGLSSVTDALEYVPMLWSTRSDFTSVWHTNAKAAIAAGAKNFLGFNEPDNVGQANMDAATAAAGHIQYLNPYCDEVACSTPAITNSNVAGESVDWLESFVSACAGECKYSFCAAHWYSPADTADFLSFTQKVSTACGGLPVWITEFAPTGDDATVAAFLTEVQDQLDNNSTYSFVERYAYFMVADGNLVSGTSASTIGNTFAFGA